MPAAEYDAGVLVEVVDLDGREHDPQRPLPATRRRSTPPPRGSSRTARRRQPESFPSFGSFRRPHGGTACRSGHRRRPGLALRGTTDCCVRRSRIDRAPAHLDRSPCRLSRIRGRPGSAVESSSAQRRPNRRGGSRNVDRLGCELNSTTNESSTTCSPCASGSGSRRRSGTARSCAGRRAPVAPRHLPARPCGTTRCRAGPSRAATRR